MTYFAAALACSAGLWSAEEVDLDEIENLEALAEHLRELAGEGEGPSLLLFEEDDEYVAIVRVDGGAGSLDEPRVFLSDMRAVQASEVAAMLWEDSRLSDAVEDDDDEGTHPVAEPVGDTGVVADLGTSADALLALCAEEGLLPADVLAALGERGGFADVLEQVREG